MELSTILSSQPSSIVPEVQPHTIHPPPPPPPSLRSSGHNAFYSAERLVLDTRATQRPGVMTSASPIDTLAGAASASSANGSVSPRQTASPKHVQFELLFADGPQYRARLPLRVQIYPHDSTDSIVTTVKNFYGLYPRPNEGKGVSFEDDQGNTLIARYENFSNNMVVHVRVIEETPPPYAVNGSAPFQPAPTLSQPFVPAECGPSTALHGDQQYIQRPSSRTSRIRSQSPNGGRGRRSASVSTDPTTGKKGRSRSSKNRSANGDSLNESMNGYSSGDGAPGSVSSKIKEQIGNTDISVDNIVEGGRRKRAKFESSVSPSWFSRIQYHCNLTSTSHRSCHYLHLLRCQLPRPTLPYPQRAALNTSDRLSLLPTPANTRTHS
jgi:hypothetical protein